MYNCNPLSMSRLSLQIAVQSFLVVYLLGSAVAVSNNNTSTSAGLKTKCIDGERQTLLKFKDNLRAQYDFLPSWGFEEEKKDCCLWDGIRCDNITGHVIMLDLSDESLSMKGKYPNPPLIELRYLSNLVLKGNNFSNLNYILSFVGNMVSLQHLDLSSCQLEGFIPETFGNNMTSLTYLDLSFNDLKGPIPKSFGNMTLLKSLQLWRNALEGSIPETFGKMASLTYLDLSSNHLNGSIPNSMGNMTVLKHLDLSGNNLEGFNMLEAFGNMASLSYLNLRANKLKSSILITLGNLSSTNLSHLDLSGNELGGSIPKSFGEKMTALEYLDLGYNKLEGFIPEDFGNNMVTLTHLFLDKNLLEGPIPKAFGNMSTLEYLDLHNNRLSGEIPESLWSICTLQELHMDSNSLSGELPLLTPSSSSTCANHSLQYLDLHDNRITRLSPSLAVFSYLESLYLSSNRINGNLHPSIGQLSQLQNLDLSNNSLEGVISEAHFAKLSKLKELDLSSNKLLAFNVSSSWVPPFKLDSLRLGSCCKLGPKFPRWLQNQDISMFLDISNAGISDSIPDWFWTIYSGVNSVNASYNQLHEVIVANSSVQLRSYYAIDLSYNQLQGTVPTFLFEAAALYLSSNNFSSIDSMCGVKSSSSSSSPSSSSHLSVLDMSHNRLSGNLPNCLWLFENLQILNLGNNRGLSGEIPTSIESLTRIQTLQMTNSQFTGDLPLSLKDCKDLVVLDLGHNNLSGPIPTWLGKEFPYLLILNLRSNRFYGKIPPNLCDLPRLQLLVLSINNISGRIPKCFGNFSEMKTVSDTNSTAVTHYYDSDQTGAPISNSGTYEDEIQVIWKGILSEYGKTLGLVKGIDLSTNMLSGEIPVEITELVGLIYFNLSTNNLTGPIPPDIGNLKSLDFLDLSNNRLSGRIPPSLALIDRLSLLDLSNNNLSGKIPTSTQLQSFNVDAYMGNMGLCGAPLPRKCPGDEEPVGPPSASTTEEYREDEFISHGFYVSMGVGYGVGFCGVFGTLLLNRSWRFAYFNFLNHLAAWIYVTVALQKAKVFHDI